MRPHLLTLLLLGTVLVGCGNEAAGGQPLPGAPYSSPVPSGGDPAVSAAADRLSPMLKRDFASTFSGLVVDHAARVVYVYRIPDAALDARVRGEVTSVTVELRDGKMNLRDAEALRDRVMADSAYWKRQGIKINGAGPNADGSGVNVMTSEGSAGERDQLVKRYGTDAITVTKESPAIMVPMTVRPTITPS